MTLDKIDGPCVSVYLPTHSTSDGSKQDSLRLRGLLASVREEMEASGERSATVDAFLEPLDALVDDRQFWRYQSAGLALFRAADFTAAYRLPLDVVEQAHFGDTFRVAQLAPLMSGDGTFFVLSLSQNDVQLFEATRDRIVPLELEDVPGSKDEALAYEDPERQLQARSAGTGATMYHGHGAGDEVDKAAVERFIQAVVPGIDKRLRDAKARPLVVASVAYYLPMLKAASDHPLILDDMIEGSPDRRSPEDLHRDAWPLVEPVLAQEADAQLAAYRELTGTGKTSTDAEDIATRAEEGAIAQLFVSPGHHDDPRVDRAVFATLRTGGGVLSVAEPLEDSDAPMAALFRY